MEKKECMKKSVTFNEHKNEVFLMIVWDFAYRNSRKNDYKKILADRLRFKRRIRMCEENIIKILDYNHRQIMYNYIIKCKINK